MIARLTASLIAFCIALPMCWCCVHGGPQAPVAACCAKEAHEAGQQPQNEKDKNCPCAKHEAVRDVATTFVKAPAPALKLLALPPPWFSELAGVLERLVAPNAARHDHGPPRSALPVYARHCALLL